MARMKLLPLLVLILSGLSIAHVTPSSEVCKDIGENGWFEGSEVLFDEDCQTGVPPQLCNTDALKCSHGKCCVSHSVCGRGSALLGDAPQMCRKETDCLGYGISSVMSAKCVEGVCCREKIVKLKFDPTGCVQDKIPSYCDCNENGCICAKPDYSCYQFKKGSHRTCCRNILCKTGLLPGYHTSKKVIKMYPRNEEDLRTGYMEAHQLCSIPLPSELRKFIKGYEEFFADSVEYHARGFNKSHPSLLPTCSLNKDCSNGSYCDDIYSQRKDESRKACFEPPKLYGKVVLDPLQSGFFHCASSADCKGLNQYCFIGSKTFNRLKGICLEVEHAKFCETSNECGAGKFCSQIFGEADRFGDPRLLKKVCYDDPIVEEAFLYRDLRTNDLTLCDSTCDGLGAACFMLPNGINGFKGVCTHALTEKSGLPVFTLINGAPCKDDEDCLWSTYFVEIIEEEQKFYTRNCIPHDFSWLCVHYRIDDSRCEEGKKAALIINGLSQDCILKSLPQPTHSPPPPKPTPTPPPSTTEPPTTTPPSTTAPEETTTEPDDDHFETSTTEEMVTTAVITEASSASKTEEEEDGLQPRTMIIIAAVAAVGLFIAIAAIAAFVVVRNKKAKAKNVKKDKKAKKSKKGKKAGGNSGTAKTTGSSDRTQSSSIAI